ncbi:MAG: cation transporter [Gammaproteobacteria bacterium]|nr:cation transporter [Gammaproteobacteria bacterium]
MRSTNILAALTALMILPAFAAAARMIVLDVQNMTCAVCAITVKKSLEKIPGVENVTVDFDKKTATVKFDPDEAGPMAFVKATTEAGYPSNIHK